MTTLLFLLFAAFTMPTALADECKGADCDVAAELGDALAQVDTSKKKKSLFGKIGDWIENTKKQFAPTPAERAAIALVHDMLEPNKLGGADRTFNQNDIDRIIDALITDAKVQEQIRVGIQAEAGKKVAEAPALFRGLVRRIANKRLTPGTRAYRKHYQEYWYQGVNQARAQISGELNQALNDENIVPVEGQQASDVPRDITLEELEKFQEAVGTMKAYGDRISKKLGVEVGGGDMKNGLSQSMVEGIIKKLP